MKFKKILYFRWKQTL